MRFYLGTHEVSWLAKTDVPLFISRRRLFARKTFPRALGRWALDSGGFSELSTHGRWTVPPAQYVAEVRRFRDAIGGMDWAAIQDWMCEPDILKKTGLTVEEHQRRTVENYLELRALAPELPWVPVVQGWGWAGDYRRCVELYWDHGVDLRTCPTVGVGTVCRRQQTITARFILRELHELLGDRLHGFGFKVTGLRECATLLRSADSLAWSFQARRQRREEQLWAPSDAPGRQNNIDAALEWRMDLLDRLPDPPLYSAIPR